MSSDATLDYGRAKEKKGVALLLVDIQYDFIEGSLAVPDAESILPFVTRLIEEYPFDLLVLSQDYHPAQHVSFASSHPDGPGAFQTFDVAHPVKRGERVRQMLWPDHCVQGTQGAEIHKDVWRAVERRRRDKMTPVHVVRKGTEKSIDGYSAFADNAYLSFTDLPRVLFSGTQGHRPIDTLVVVGLATDYCVSSSAIDAAKFHLETIVPLQGVRGVARETSEGAISEMQGYGIQVLSTEEDLRKALQVV